MHVTITPSEAARVLRIRTPHAWALVWTEADAEVDDVALRVRFDEAATRFVVTRLTITNDAGLSTALLRDVALGRLRDVVVAAMVVSVPPAVSELVDATDGAAVTGFAGTLDVPTLPRGLEGVEAIVHAATAEDNRRRITDEKLRQVAEVYRAAVEAGRPVQRAVMRECGAATVSTAGKWIHNARRRGFLRETTPGKRGEHDE